MHHKKHEPVGHRLRNWKIDQVTSNKIPKPIQNNVLRSSDFADLFKKKEQLDLNSLPIKVLSIAT